MTFINFSWVLARFLLKVVWGFVSFFFFFLIGLFYIEVFCLHACVCAMCCSAHRGQRTLYLFQELEFQVVVSYHVGNRNGNSSPLQEQQVLFTTEHLSTTCVLIFK